jgi:hypothetical protein
VPITRDVIKWCSFFFSTIYTVLLVLWLGQIGPPELKTIFGFTHGIGWFFMVALALYGLKARLIDLRLAVCIAVFGAVGPYFGTAEFLWQDRNKRAPSFDEPPEGRTTYTA